MVTRLRRSLYGLKQAGREWHITLFASTLKRFGFTQSCIDTRLFVYRRSESFICVVVWVDDCIIMDNDVSHFRFERSLFAMSAQFIPLKIRANYHGCYYK